MDIRPVDPTHPGRDQSLGSSDYFLLWAGVAISLAEIWAGGLLAPMGFVAGLLAILLGHLIGNTLMGLGGLIGSDQGIPAMVSVRPSFGIRGSNFAAVLNIVQLICWASIMLIIGGRAGASLGASLDAGGGILTSQSFWILIIGFGTLAWALLTGGRIWKILQGVSVVGLIGVVAVMTWKTALVFGEASSPTRLQSSSSMPFMTGLDLVIAMPISWLPLVADYSRFAKPNARAFWSTWWGYFLVSSWMFVLGLMATLVTQSPDPQIQMNQVLGGAGLAIPALALVVLSTITSDFPDLYSATCSMMNVAPRLPAKAFMVATGIVSILVALVFPMERYESFLFLIGAMFIPVFGIVLTDYFFIRHRALDMKDLYRNHGEYWYSAGFNPRAFFAWSIGFAAYKLVEWSAIPIGASLPAIAVSAGVYYATMNKKR